jgi:hypothetical protein
MEVVTGGHKEFLNETLHNLYSSPKFIRVVNARKERLQPRQTHATHSDCVSVTDAWRSIHIHTPLTILVQLWGVVCEPDDTDTQVHFNHRRVQMLPLSCI